MYNPVGPVMTFSSARELKGIDSMKDLKARRLLKGWEMAVLISSKLENDFLYPSNDAENSFPERSA